MIEVNRLTLDNGIRLVHNTDSATAMVALNVLVNAGARHESPDRTGLAHLVEHMMFGGSANVPDFDRAIEEAGGMDNAYTTSDFTNYYSIAPAENAETLFWIESDRLIAPLFDPTIVEIQKSVVTEEFKQTTLNRPYGDSQHLLRSLIYREHPYRWPVIGLDPSHIAEATADDVRDFWNHHYTPDNIILAVSGNISWDQCRLWAEKWFGTIPSRPSGKRSIKREPQQESPRTLDVTRHVPTTTLTMAFPMAAYGEPGYQEADIATDLLASGHASRFYRRLLIGSDMFTGIDASISGSEDAGYLMLHAKLRNGTDITRAKDTILSESLKIADANDIRPDEMERLANRHESESTFANMEYLNRAQTIAMAELHGEDINTANERYRAVTASAVAETVRNVIVPERCNTLVYRAESQ